MAMGLRGENHRGMNIQSSPAGEHGAHRALLEALGPDHRGMAVDAHVARVLARKPIATAGAGAGAAGGAAGALTRGVIRSGDPDPVYQRFVEKCLRDKGYEPIGWR